MQIKNQTLRDAIYSLLSPKYSLLYYYKWNYK